MLLKLKKPGKNCKSAEMVKSVEELRDGGKTRVSEVIDQNRENKSSSKGATDKERFQCNIDPVLLKYKIFFFLFFAGFGTTFPYLGIYFKQLGLSAASVGVLAGVRPLIQFISGPFWAILADKYRARKAVLLFSIFAWLVMTVVLAFPRPHNVVCKAVNVTLSAKEKSSYSVNGQKKDKIPNIKGSIGELLLPVCFPVCKHSETRAKRGIDRRKNIFSYYEGKGKPQSRDNNNSYSEHDITIETYLGANQDAKNIRNSSNTTTGNHADGIRYVIKHDPDEIRNLFMIFFILIVSGEFLEAPTFIMIDTALLDHLGENRASYGKTRLFGSIGYGVASFGIGAILDHTHYIYCGRSMVNYTFLFYIFAGFMLFGFFFALFAVSFSYEKTQTEKASLMEVIKLLSTLKYSSFLAIAWFLGFSHGGIMNFLNWYLEDLGATRFMMGIGTLCRSIAIIFGFLNSNFFINKFGHPNMILFALVVYTISFFGYSIVPNPWYALPIEFGQGFCYSISWSACITYLGAAAPPNAAATVQGMPSFFRK